MPCWHAAPPPTAAFCANDIQAIGALYECRDSGIAIPRDMSIIGFDDLPIASYISPAVDDRPRAGRRDGRTRCPRHHRYHRTRLRCHALRAFPPISWSEAPPPRAGIAARSSLASPFPNGQVRGPGRRGRASRRKGGIVHRDRHGSCGRLHAKPPGNGERWDRRGGKQGIVGDREIMHERSGASVCNTTLSRVGRGTGRGRVHRSAVNASDEISARSSFSSGDRRSCPSDDPLRRARTVRGSIRDVSRDTAVAPHRQDFTCDHRAFHVAGDIGRLDIRRSPVASGPADLELADVRQRSLDRALHDQPVSRTDPALQRNAARYEQGPAFAVASGRHEKGRIGPGAARPAGTPWACMPRGVPVGAFSGASCSSDCPITDSFEAAALLPHRMASLCPFRPSVSACATASECPDMRRAVDNRVSPGLNDIEIELADDGQGPALCLRQGGAEPGAARAGNGGTAHRAGARGRR